MQTLQDYKNKLSSLYNELKSDESVSTDIISNYENDIKGNFENNEILKYPELVDIVLNTYIYQNRLVDAFFLIKELSVDYDSIANSVLFESYLSFLCQLSTFLIEEDNDNKEGQIPEYIDFTDPNLMRVVNRDMTSREVIKILSSSHINLSNEQYTQLYLALITEIVSNTNSTPASILTVIRKINPEKLSENIQSILIKTGKDLGKSKEAPSEKENFYILLINTLFDCSLYDECLELCNNCKSILGRVFPASETIINVRAAQSLLKKGETDKALTSFKNLLISKKEWLIQKEYADVLYSQGDIDLALKYSIDAALNYGFPKEKLSLYTLIGELLLRKNESDLAKQHFLLSALLYKEEHKPLPDNLNTILHTFNVKESGNLSSRLIVTELTRYWLSTLKKGAITKVMHDKKIGWIKSGDASYFFRFTAFRGDLSKLTEGASVMFSWDYSFDKVKQVETKDAGYITLA